MLSLLLMSPDSFQVRISSNSYFTKDLEDSIKFLEDAKARLVNKNDAVFICKIA